MYIFLFFLACTGSENSKGSSSKSEAAKENAAMSEEEKKLLEEEAEYLEGVKAALAKLTKDGKDIDYDSIGNPLLIQACSRGSLEAVRYLISSGADVNKSGENGMTALMKISLSSENSLEILDALIQAGAEVDAKDSSGRTALNYFSSFKDLKRVQKLVELGANISIVDEKGNSPLITAAKARQSDVVEFLLNQPKIDIEVEDKGGSTALERVVMSNQQEDKENDLKIVQLLLEKGARVSEECLKYDTKFGGILKTAREKQQAKTTSKEALV